MIRWGAVIILPGQRYVFDLGYEQDNLSDKGTSEMDYSEIFIAMSLEFIRIYYRRYGSWK